MGYYSTLWGSFTPDKKIPDDIASRINDADLSVVVKLTEEAPDVGEIGDIVPWSTSMKAHGMAEDMYKVQRLLSSVGIKLNGSIERHGEDDYDFELFTAKKGELFRCIGEIVYKKHQKITSECVTSYCVKLVQRDNDGNQRHIGWLESDLFCEISPDTLRVHEPCDAREAPEFRTREDADKAMAMYARDGIMCELITRERVI